MNFSELGTQLHITRQGARALVLRNKSKLKKYLILKNKKIVGVNSEAIEVIYSLQERTSNQKKIKDLELERLKLENNFLNKEINLINKSLNDKEKQLENLTSENEKLKSLLSSYQSLNLFQRLLGYKPK